MVSSPVVKVSLDTYKSSKQVMLFTNTFLKASLFYSNSLLVKEVITFVRLISACQLSSKKGKSHYKGNMQLGI